MNFYKTLFTSLALLTVFIFTNNPKLMAAQIIDTSNCPVRSAVCEDINDTTGRNNNQLFGPDGVVTKITRFMIVLTGVISVFMFIYAGITYITSAGDTKKITTAKNTIIYAAIGIVIALTAQALVSFIMVNIK